MNLWGIYPDQNTNLFIKIEIILNRLNGRNGDYSAFKFDSDPPLYSKNFSVRERVLNTPGIPL